MTAESIKWADLSMARKKKQLFVFRRYKKKEGGSKKSRHPKLIVEESNTEYGFMGLTKDSHTGHHANIPLKKNPQKNNKNQSYIRKELRYDKKDSFEKEILSDYKLSAEDKKIVLDYYKKHKKKRL